MQALLAGTLIACAGGAASARETDSPLHAYARARVAASSGQSAEAARAYAAALRSSPDNDVLASRTFVEALSAGERALALQAASVLERKGAAGADARLVLLSDALNRSDWKRSSLQIEALAKDEAFGFLAPALRAWLALGSRKGNPFEALQAGESNPLSKAYSAEHRALLLLATGNRQQGIQELLAVSQGNGFREQRLRIAGAALLQRTGDAQAALTLLTGDGAALAAARRLVEGRKALPGAIASPSAGVAEYLVRLSGDLARQDVGDLALRLARVATFLAPENSETWLVAADLLAAEGQHAPALAALDQVKAGDPFAAAAEDARIRLLTASGQQQTALARARAAAGAPAATSAEWTRLGMLYSELDQLSEASAAFGRAIALRREGRGSEPEWTLHFLRGGALEQAGRWPEAKAELEAAYKLAPEQPVVLNYLGYAQLERRENVAEAIRLVTQASRLAPDSPEITDSLGWAHFLQGDLPKAVELLERAATAAPADPEINEHLGDAYYKAGRRFEARYAWGAALLYAETKDAQRIRSKIEVGLTPELASP